MEYPVVTDAARPDLGGNFRHGDDASFTPNLWRYLVARFGISSVLDVGCGEGHAVRFFHSLGLHAHGIDGLLTNVERAVVPIALHDLTTGPYRMPVDLVISIEVAEHIAPEYVDHFLDTIANGRVICMTAALPNQDGYHHVNCHPPEYWIGKMAQRGYILSHENEIYRQVCATDIGPKHFITSGLILLKE